MGWSGGLPPPGVAHPPEQRRGVEEERVAPFLLNPREEWPDILSQHVVRAVVVRHEQLTRADQAGRVSRHRSFLCIETR